MWPRSTLCSRLSGPDIERFQKEIRRYWNGVAWQNPYAVTLTLKQTLGSVKLDQISASRNTHHFLNRLNRHVLGRRQSARGRLKTFSVLEGFQQPHFHLCVDCPIKTDFQSFEKAVHSCWIQTQWHRRQVCITSCNNVEGWLEYMTKKRTKACYPEAIDWENCYR